MQYTLTLPGKKLKLYYSEEVYSPEYTSVGSILLVDKLIKDAERLDTSVLDVGCGSGVLGLGVKLLNPFADVILCDIDPEALRITRLNAKRLGFGVGVYRADLVPALGFWHIIVANLPTYTKEQLKQELHGPLVAYDGNGLEMYKELFKQATGRCKALVAECQPTHQKEFLELALKFGFIRIMSSGDSFAFLTPPML